MSYINATLWNDLQVSDATNEKRFSELGIIDAVKASTQSVDFIPPSALQALQTASSLRNVRIPVIKDQTVTVVTTPGFEHIPSNLPESDDYFFQAYDVFSGFRHYPAAYANNMVDSDFARDTVMRNVAYGMGNTVESILSTQLEARKTQVLPEGTTQVSQGDGVFNFNTGTDTLEVSKAAQKETMFSNLNQLMDANELMGNYRIVTNRAGLAVQKSEYAKYGMDNEKNLQALGIINADRMHETGNISAGSNVFSGFWLRDGSIGVYENYPFDFANGTEINGKRWSVSDVELPYLKMRANIYTNSQATEATSLITSGTDSNLIMSHFEEMAIWCRFYVVYEYNSDLTTRANDIVKVIGTTS